MTRIADRGGAYYIGKYRGSVIFPPDMKSEGDKELKQIRQATRAVLSVHSVTIISAAAVLAVLLSITGCVRQTVTSEKIKNLKFTVLDKEEVPEELDRVIGEEKEDVFKISYADQGMLYIAQGYGGQPTSGYSVEVNEVYETENSVCIHTTLMGPEKGEKIKETVTYPYVVIQLEYIEKDVVFR